MGTTNRAGRLMVRFEQHWRRVAWAVLDKSLPLAFGVGFMLLVVRVLPPEEFGLQGIASTVLLTVSQLLRYLLLVPMTKYVAEGRVPESFAATGMLLYVLASAAMAALLAGGRDLWAVVFGKPALAAVLVPSASLLLVGSARDAAISTLEGHRRLRTLFWADCGYYAIALGTLALWRFAGAPRTAAAVQWVQASAAAAGSALAVVMAHRLLAARPARPEAGQLLTFGRYSFGSGLGATIGQQADGLLAGALMDARGVASYQVARLFFRIFNVLAQAIAQVLMPLVSRLHAGGRERDVRVLFEKSVCFLHLALLPVLAVLFLLTPQLFALFFGDRYAASITPFRILLVSAATLPFASVGSPFLIGLGRVRSLVWITWLGTAVGVGLAWIWIPRFGPSGAALGVLVAAVVGMVARTWVLQRILGFALADVAGRTRDAVAFARRRLRVS